MDTIKLPITATNITHKPNPVFKGYAWEGHHTTETKIFVGYDELFSFIKEESEKKNAREFHFWMTNI